MSYLRNIDVTFEPIDEWPTEETVDRIRSPFRVNYDQTLCLLDHELCELESYRVVIQMDLDRSKIRLDGAPRSGSTPRTPRVILSFHCKHGDLSYPCDRFDYWKDNLRAIALALEALRKVDRYGVTQRNEQYRGFLRLPGVSRTPSDGFTNDQSAWSYLREQAGWTSDVSLPDRQRIEVCFKLAQTRTHPDRPDGNAESFKWVQAAGERLGVA